MELLNHIFIDFIISAVGFLIGIIGTISYISSSERTQLKSGFHVTLIGVVLLIFLIGNFFAFFSYCGKFGHSTCTLSNFANAVFLLQKMLLFVYGATYLGVLIGYAIKGGLSKK